MMDWVLPPASKNLRLHGDSQTVYQKMMLGMALAFWVAAKIMEGPVMNPALYGEFVTQYPAEYWAASLMLASAVYLAGIIINGNWRWSPALRLTGALWHCVTLAMFSYGGMSAADGQPMMIWGGCALGVHAWFALLNIGDLWRAVRYGRT